MSKDSTISVPASDAALRALSILEDAGLEAWMVGGCVRDALLGRPVNDIDIACSGLWRESKAAFEAAGCNAFETGTAHGTITAQVDGELFEVTTYRVDGSYSDGRHPDTVTFTRSIDEDLARRDFTVNAMAYHPDRGLHDPFVGREDLAAKVLRAVGSPEKRFREDALRIVRGVRFASQLGFAIEPATAQAMRFQAAGLQRIAVERIAHELTGMLCGEHVHDALMDHADIVFAVLPELRPLYRFEQHTKYHIYDVWEHTAYVVEYVESAPLNRWAALFHDCGKPDAFFMEGDVGHFYGHAKLSVPIAKTAMGRLKLPPRFIHGVCLLVREHDTVVPPKPKSVKRMLRKLGGSESLFRDLCDLKRADSRAHAPDHRTGIGLANELEACLDQVLAEGQAFTLKQLAVKGGDIIALGVPAGPSVGMILNQLLEAVMEERVPNDRDALIDLALRLRS